MGRLDDPNGLPKEPVVNFKNGQQLSADAVDEAVAVTMHDQRVPAKLALGLSCRQQARPWQKPQNKVTQVTKTEIRARSEVRNAAKMVIKKANL